MAKLVDEKDFGKATGLSALGLHGLSNTFMNLLSLGYLNEMYDRFKDLEGPDFVTALLKAFKIQTNVSEKDLRNIPTEGGFITVSNHPMGGVEGLMLIQQVGRIRPDMKVMANYLLQRLEPISDYFLPVNPFDYNDKDTSGNIPGIKASLQHIRDGHPLCTFPAGEVSTYNTALKIITDKEWSPQVIKLIQKSEMPVVPIYFSGNNSIVFHLLGMIHPLLRTIRLPREMLNKKRRPIVMRIGKPIPFSFIEQYSDPTELGLFLRAKTYALGSPHARNYFQMPNLSALVKPRPIAGETPEAQLRAELATLQEYKIFEQGEFELYIAPSSVIPQILTEIGRLRELTFRSVDEGTGRPRDLDEFDLYYQHLFLWDKSKSRIAGAYRVGKGKEILARHGKRGFYTTSLFQYKRDFKETLSQSIELGRSFVVPEYQRKILPLFVLWKGILAFLLRNAEYRYLIGPVSISNHYSQMSKSLIYHFVRKSFYDERLAAMVVPRHPFKPRKSTADVEVLLSKSQDINFIDQLIKDIEPEGYTIPVLLKKYVKQNARIIGFNVDPKFGMALDGLMILDLNDVPAETLADLQKDLHLI
jgi:putative hemolysin